MTTKDSVNAGGSIAVTERTRLNRIPKRGVYERAEIYKILDEAMICHIGFAGPHGGVAVIPTIYGRKDDYIYIHGAPASRMLKNLELGVELCLTATILDGLVLARSAFHHSMNYRSVVVFAKATLVTDETEKWQGLYAISEHVVPGRWQEVREPNETELNGTSVLRLPLEEASAKVRTGPPADDAEDMDLPVWAGELPIKLQSLAPKADAHLAENIPVPGYLINYSR